MAKQSDENAVEWVPIETLFVKLPGLDDHAKRVIEHHLGPELQSRHLETIVLELQEQQPDTEDITWFIGCYVMRVFDRKDRIDFGWRQVSDARVDRVVELLLSAGPPQG